MGGGGKIEKETELEARSLWMYLAVSFWLCNHINGFHNCETKLSQEKNLSNEKLKQMNSKCLIGSITMMRRIITSD